MWRGGSGGHVGPDGDRVAGVGHFKTDGEHHDPFLWSFSLRDAQALPGVVLPAMAHLRVEGLAEGVTIVDPSAVLPGPGGRGTLVVATESRGGWVAHDLYRLVWYELTGDGGAPCGLWDPPPAAMPPPPAAPG